MNNDFIEINYFDFLTFKELKNETQKSLNDFCEYYLNNYNGTNAGNLESLRLFFNKYLKDSKKDCIFLTIFNNSLKVNVYDLNIDFLTINSALSALKNFIDEFKDFLNN